MSDQEELPDRMATAAAYDQNRRTQPAVPQNEATMQARKMAALKALQSESDKDSAAAAAPKSEPAASTAPKAEPAATKQSAGGAKSASSGDSDDKQKLIFIGIAVLVLLVLIIALV